MKWQKGLFVKSINHSTNLIGEHISEDGIKIIIFEKKNFILKNYELRIFIMW